jgi:diguanylate cyclase (GGDEF)-like protein
MLLVPADEGRAVDMRMAGRAHHWYLGVGALAVAAGAALPPAVQQGTYVLAGSSAIVAIVVGVRRYRPEWVLPWWLLVASVAAGILASLWWGLDLAVHGTRRFPIGGDLVYSLVQPLLVLSIQGWTRRARRTGGLVEAGIVAAGGGALMWALIVAPMLHSGRFTGLRLASYLGYVAFDLVILVLAVRMLLITRIRTPAYALLVIGAAVLIVTDVGYYVLLVGAGPASTVTAPGYLTAYLLLGAAALHPSMARSGGQPATEPDPVSRARLFGYVALVVTSAALTGYQLLATGEVWSRVLVPLALSSTMAVLLVVRLAQLAVLLDRRARLDALTGLPNLTALREQLAGSAATGLLLVDLDGFREVNDSHGHRSGDEILCGVADRLRDLCAGHDAVAMRLGGDEFAVLTRGATPPEELAAAVVAALRAPYPVPGAGCVLLTASVGVVNLADTGGPHGGGVAQEPSGALRRADLALYTGQSNGGDQVAVYDAALHAARQERTRLVRDLDRALSAGEFTLYYQPIVDLRTGAVRAAEALLRWTRADGTHVPPDAFIPVAEQSGAIVPIGTWVIEQACDRLRRWWPRYGVPVTVNVSARQLRRPDFAATVLTALRASGVPGRALIVEITETGLITAIADAATVTAQLRTLRQHGVRIAIDDFGTGYSSLAYLRQLPVDILKMDGSFTTHQVEVGAPRDCAFVRAIVELAGSLDLLTVAEAVETAEQADRLAALGCQLAQGYHFARPEPADVIDRMLAAQPARAVA